MSRAYWDSQMNFSAIIRDFADILDAAARDSADWSRGRQIDRIAYGPDPRQWVEVTQGLGTADTVPVILHGGYWRALRAKDHRFLMGAMLPFGANVANLEYRLMPDVRLADVVADTLLGIAAVAGRFPSSDLILIGHSAGAHLAVSTLDHAVIASRIRGAIALSGVYDLRPVRASSLQDEIGLTAEEVERFTLGPRSGRAPVIYVNGTHETHESIRGSLLMASEGRSRHVFLDDANHMTLMRAAVANMNRLVETLEHLV